MMKMRKMRKMRRKRKKRKRKRMRDGALDGVSEGRIGRRGLGR